MPTVNFEREIATLMERTLALESANAKAVERSVALERENKILREELAVLKQGLFGRRTERIAPGQLDMYLLGSAHDLVLQQTVSAPTNETAPSRPPVRGHGRAQFPEHLPREVVELDVPEAERICPDCGKPMRSIGADTTERGHVVPARIVVRRFVRQKYACPDGHAVKTAAAPEGVIDGAKYEASVYAHVATSKYADHLPLHRLEGIFKRHGVHLPKQTMWDMLVTVDELLAQPVLRQMHKELLCEQVLHTDETPVTLRLENGKGSKQGYAWGWRNLHGVGPSKVLIEFKTSRSRDGPLDFLKEWSGTLIGDGYSGLNEVVERNDIVRAGCWAHARRKFKEALDTGTRNAASVLVPIQRLFWLERAMTRRAKRLNFSYIQLVELRRQVRERRSAGVVDLAHARADQLSLLRSTLPESKLGKALGYLRRQRNPLSTFLADARIPIHNNDEERDLRHLAMGRNNWLIFASERGGHVACRLYSLILSCKQAGVDPEAYIEDVLGRLSTTKASDIAELTPWAWAAARK
jgi:transposase